MDLLPDGTWLMMLIVVFEVPVLVLLRKTDNDVELCEFRKTSQKDKVPGTLVLRTWLRSRFVSAERTTNEEVCRERGVSRAVPVHR